VGEEDGDELGDPVGALTLGLAVGWELLGAADGDGLGEEVGTLEGSEVVGEPVGGAPQTRRP
jgi:hypothetical protein